MTFTLVEVTEIGNAKVPFPLVQLVEVGANSIRRAVTTYVAVGSTIFLYPNDRDFDAVEIGETFHFSVATNTSSQLIGV